MSHTDADAHTVEAGGTAAPRSRTDNVLNAKSTLEKDSLSLSIFVLLVASIVEFATAADQCNTADTCDGSRETWSIVVGVISAIFCIVWLVMRFFLKVTIPPKVDLVLACFLVIWWSFGAGYNTSPSGPFPATGNGYFSTWAAFFASGFYLAQAYVAVYGNPHSEAFHHVLTFVLIFSVIEMAVAADLCERAGTCETYMAWAVAVGVITTAFCLIQMAVSQFAHSNAQTSGRVIAFLLVVLWGFGVGFNTSASGPFTTSCLAANGYFASWLAFVCAVIYGFRVLIEKVDVDSA